MHVLARYLQRYGSHKSQYLIDGFTNGFKLGFNGTQQSVLSGNLTSALDNPAVIDKKLDKETAMGRIAGPFLSPPFANFRCSPLGIVPKKTFGEFRLIHHLSYPDNSSVNAGIDREFSRVHYAGIETAIQMIKKCHVPPYLAKTDVESAFRVVPIHPSDYHLLGFSWRGKYYYDKVLPMGCSSSCRIFEAFSSALEWVSLHKTTASHVCHILDDFLFVEESRAACQESLHSFTVLCSEIGVPLAANKTFPPSQVMDFVGITLDTVHRVALLPQEKIDRCVLLLTSLQLEKRSLLKNYNNYLVHSILPAQL